VPNTKDLLEKLQNLAIKVINGDCHTLMQVDQENEVLTALSVALDAE
jgi:hypothetical protein